MGKSRKIEWIAFFGKIKVTAEGIKYIPVFQKEGQNQGAPVWCSARSNCDFENGTISFKVKLNHEDNGIQVALNQTAGANEVFAGITPGPNVGYSYIISVLPNNSGGKWENLSSAGLNERPPINEDVYVEVSVIGSRIDLRINGVLVCTGYYRIIPSQIGLLMGGPEEMTVRDFKISPHKPRAFVVMQFTDEFNSLYSEVIQPTCEKYGLIPIRADDIYNNGLILDDITRSIRECFVIIADITPNNMNVFYEVGYAHGINKATILLADKKRDKLPFDISGFRTLFYDNTIGGKTAIEERLSQHLKALTNK